MFNNLCTINFSIIIIKKCIEERKNPFKFCNNIYALPLKNIKLHTIACIKTNTNI